MKYYIVTRSALAEWGDRQGYATLADALAAIEYPAAERMLPDDVVVLAALDITPEVRG